MKLPLTACLMACALIVAPHTAAAQGNGRPKGPKNPNQGKSGSSNAGTTTGSTTTSTPAAAAPAAAIPSLTPVTTFRQFGSWLDDASAPVAGEGYVNISAGHWLLNGMSQTNMPMISGGVGLNDRVQLNASVPFYRVTYDGTTARGLDDMYVSAKYSVIDPALNLREFGLAVTPVMEVLSAGATDGRVHFALPVSLEIRRAPVRVYGSAGYFTRGAFFSGGAVEWTTPRALSVTVGVTQSQSLGEDVTLDALGVSRRRADVSGSVGWPLTPAVAASVSVGRSLSSIAEGGTRLSVSGGLSIRFATPTATP